MTTTTKCGQVRKTWVLIIHSCETYHFGILFFNLYLTDLSINEISIPLKVSVGLEETVKFLPVFPAVFFETGFVVSTCHSDIMQ